MNREELLAHALRAEHQRIKELRAQAQERSLVRDQLAWTLHATHGWGYARIGAHLGISQTRAYDLVTRHQATADQATADQATTLAP